MAVILDLRVGSSTEDQLKYLKEQLERILTEMEDKTGGVQSIETVLNDDNTMSLIITDMTGNKTETEIQNAAGVESIVTQYYLSTSKTTQTGGSWVATQPEWEPDHYLWQRNLITWTDGDVAGTSPRLMSAINEACEKAYAALQPEDVTVSQNPTQTGYEVTIGEETFSLLNGTDGADGADGAPGSPGADGFSPIATVTKTGDLATITITDKNGVTSESVSDGADGADGSDGISVTSIQSQYYLSTSPSSATGGSWSNSLTYETGKYIWTRDQITYSNNTVDYSTAIYNQALTSACSSAHEAEAAATTANTAANGALTGLSTVQDVIGALNWAQENAIYSLTQDTDIIPGKTYWTRSGAGTSADPYVYTRVTNPVKTDLNIYFEITGVERAMADYINMHLALTDEGLSVLKTANGWRLLVKNDGVFVINNQGNVVSKYKDSITLGNDDGSQSFLKEDYHSLQLFDKKNAEILGCDEYDSRLTYEVGDTIYQSDSGSKRYYKCKTAITTPMPWDSTYWTRIYPSAFFHVSDLTDAEGIAVLTQVIDIQNEGISYVEVKYPIYNGSYSISVNGNEATVTQWTEGSQRIYVYQPVLHAGDIVVVTYKTKSDGDMFAYTFGNRKAESNIGITSVAMGFDVDASGDYSHGEGIWVKASGHNAHSEGNDTTASGEAAHAEGSCTRAKGLCCHAEGQFAVAKGHCSHAGGFNTKASSDAQTVIGRTNIEDKYNNYAFIVGNGTMDDSPSYVGELPFDPWNDSNVPQENRIYTEDSYENPSNALTVDWHGRVKCGDYSGNLKSIFDIFYPVGSYYETSDGDFDPEAAWGGEWILETAGLVHVSGDTGDANYPVSSTYTDANNGAGQKQDGDEDAIVPKHDHPITRTTNVAVTVTKSVSNADSITGGSHGHKIKYNPNTGASGSARHVLSASGSSETSNNATSSDTHTHSVPQHAHSTSVTQPVFDVGDRGVDGTGKNMQPYINVYRWHRVG